MEDEDKIDLEKYRVPVWCPQCNGPMKGRSTVTYYKWGVCQICHLEFIEDREERWNSGWRPSQEELKAYEEKYNSSIYSNSSLPDI